VISRCVQSLRAGPDDGDELRIWDSSSTGRTVQPTNDDGGNLFQPWLAHHRCAESADEEDYRCRWARQIKWPTMQVDFDNQSMAERRAL
jgi:hypothetical protein